MIRTVDENGDHFETKHRCKDGSIYDVEISTNGAIIAGQKLIFCVCRNITRRKQMEAALKESEEKFSKVFTSSPNAICLMSIEKPIFVEVNDSFTRFTGYSREEIIGKSPFGLGLCENEEDLVNITKAIRETGHIFNERIQSQMKSGEFRSGLLSAETIEVGGEKRLIVVITDITEQVNMEEALRESEEKFSKTFKASPEIIAIIALKDGRYVDVNDSFTYYTGYARKELIGHTTRDIDIWANKEDRDERLRILIEQGRVSNKEYDFRTKSGEIRTWLYSAEPLTIGGELCLMSASIDITERKRMQETIANEAIRRRILIEQSSDGIVIVDQTGKVYDVNWRFAEMLGYTMEEAANLYIWDWYAEHTREELMDMIKSIDAEGDHFTGPTPPQGWRDYRCGY